MNLGALAFLITDSAKIPFSMLVVFISAKLMSEILERLGQPGIVGEILAGVLIGPSVLGWVAPSDFLSALADLGASDTLLIFLLKGSRPHKYRDNIRQELAGADGAPLVPTRVEVVLVPTPKAPEGH